MTYYDRISIAVQTRSEKVETMIDELKQSSEQLLAEIRTILEPPEPDLVNLHAFSDREGCVKGNVPLIGNYPPREAMHDWSFFSQLRIHLTPPGRVSGSVTIFALIKAEYNNNEVKFTRVNSSKEPIGSSMTLADFARDCVEGELGILEEDPRKRGASRAIGFIKNE